ncbi:MFS transporter [Mitsuaria sp. GD03876]|uniref:MFS transporter n=1 Tax=Mitsuaria sp. GD03876 TaxID=2975399 RepID=UPI00244BD196|nr:MFS transporter [Mitsuaria sp. GD03876]MDH0863094.1 MFS transporter [Mitsuaria sp. GD03876]
MSSSPPAAATSTASPNAQPTAPMSRALVLLLAVGAGLSVAPLYYAQPMLGLLSTEFGASASQIGLIPTLTQLGYAAAILLLAPLGDRIERRRLIAFKSVALLLALVIAAVSPNLAALCLASVLIGITASLAQDLLPAAATLAPDAQRGQTVGTVMTGLLLGILLSRVVSGTLAQQFGWRWVFGIAAVSVLLLGIALQRGLPRMAPASPMPYGELLRSMVTLTKRYPALRTAAATQALLAVGFSAFWSTLAVMLHQELNLGSAAAGAFGLAGAAGALAAPLAGRVADKRGPRAVIRVGATLVLLSFVGMGLLPSNLWVLVAGTVLFDLGVQSALVAHQSIVYGLEPPARSRLNAVLIGAMFIGMASGAWLGSVALQSMGWRGVCGLAVLTSAGALLLRVRADRASAGSPAGTPAP